MFPAILQPAYQPVYDDRQTEYAGRLFHQHSHGKQCAAAQQQVFVRSFRVLQCQPDTGQTPQQRQVLGHEIQSGSARIERKENERRGRYLRQAFAAEMPGDEIRESSVGQTHKQQREVGARTGVSEQGNQKCVGIKQPRRFHFIKIEIRPATVERRLARIVINGFVSLQRYIEKLPAYEDGEQY